MSEFKRWAKEVKKPTIILCCCAGALACGFAGFNVGARYTDANRERPLTGAFERDEAGGITFYTYYSGSDGKPVIHGKHYYIGGGNTVVSDYRDGRPYAFSATSGH